MGEGAILLTSYSSSNSGSTLLLQTIQYCGSSDNMPGSVIIVYSESHSVHCTIYSIDTPEAYKAVWVTVKRTLGVAGQKLVFAVASSLIVISSTAHINST